MWRIVLSVVAVVWNVFTLLFTVVLGLGFAVGVSQGGQPNWLLFGLVVGTGLGGVVSIVAIAVGARLGGRAKGTVSQVAAEFS